MGARRLKTAAMKMTVRRPSQLLRGSEIHAALEDHVRLVRWVEHRDTYKTKIAIYGQELMNPTIHEFLSQIASFPG